MDQISMENKIPYGILFITIKGTFLITFPNKEEYEYGLSLLLSYQGIEFFNKYKDNITVRTFATYGYTGTEYYL